MFKKTHSIVFVILLGFIFFPTFTHAFTLTRSSNMIGLNSGLVGWWTFDGRDMTNGRANDVSGNGNHGNLVNIATSTFYTQGKVGQGFRFDGGDDYVKVNDNVTFDPTNTITVSAWVKPSMSAGTTDRVIVSKMRTLSFSGWSLYQDSNEKYSFKIINTGSATSSSAFLALSDTTFADTSWHHVVGVYNGVDVRIYVDGVNADATPAATTIYLSDTANSVCIGQANGASGICDGGSTFFPGIIDDTRVYNRALSATEILKLYNQGAGTKVNATPDDPLKTGLIGHWTFDGKNVVNGRALDSSGNGNSGTVTGIATSTFYTSGKIGQGFRFDGTNSFVSIADSALWDTITTQLTVSAWVKPRLANSTVGNALVGRTRSLSGFPGWHIERDSSERYLLRISDGTAVTAQSDSVFQDTKWHHIVGVYNGVDARIYVDGINADATPPAYTNSLVADTRPLCIGTSQGGSASCTTSLSLMFPGIIDDARVYSRALSATEVKKLYNQGAGTKINATPDDSLRSGLVGWWTFDGKNVVNGVARDTSGNSKHANLRSIATTTFYKTGKIGQGFDFDGVDDYITPGNVSSSVKSLAFWIKAKDITKKIIDLNSTATIETSSGTITANNFTSPTIYVNGAVTSTITANTWYHVVITTGTAINASAVDIGRISSGYFSGMIDDVRMYSSVLSANDIMTLYNQGR